MADSKSTAKTVPSEKSEAKRNYVVKVTRVGPWPEGHVFSEAEFKRLHPLPDNQQTRDAGMFDEGGAAEYHESLLARLLELEHIGHADPGAPPMLTEPGPENRTKAPKRAGGEKPADEKDEAAKK